MKERIVIKDEIFAEFLIENKDNHSISASPKVIMDRCRVEQVPETWIELLELCAKYEELDTVNFILIKGVWFNEDGEVSIGEEIIAKNRTPEQMWQIIKSLIGEE